MYLDYNSTWIVQKQRIADIIKQSQKERDLVTLRTNNKSATRPLTSKTMLRFARIFN